MRLSVPPRRRVWLAVPAVLVVGCVAYTAPVAYVDPVPAATDAKSPALIALVPQALDVGAAAVSRVAPRAVLATRTLTVLPELPRDRHVVAAGETLMSVARDRLGSAARWREIVRLNPGLTPTSMSVGQSLVLP